MSAWDGLVDQNLAKILAADLSLPSPTPIQSACIHMITPPFTDYIIRAPTGSGKTLALLLPLVTHLLRREDGQRGSRDTGTHILYLSPTRELALQTFSLVEAILGKLRPHWMTCCLLSGAGANGQESSQADQTAVSSNRKREKEWLRKGQTVVVGTPGRVLDHLQNTSGWKRDRLQFLVLDEADRLLDSGFGPKVREISELAAAGHVLYCSATASDASAQSMVSLKENVVVVEAGDGAAHAANSIMCPELLVQQYTVVSTKQRLALLVSLLNGNFRRMVVFMSNCDSVDYHHALFSKQLVPDTRRSLSILKLHGNMPLSDRRSTIDGFSALSERAVLLCTDVAARGLNLGGSGAVDLIVQYDPPSDRLDYVHRAGRSARGVQASGRSVLVLQECEAAYVQLLKEKHGIVLEHVDSKQLLSWLDAPSKPEDRKGRFGLWLKRLVENIRKHAEVAAMGRRAYASSIRAYATHPADERHIFHIRRLHLGHLASSFGLEEVAGGNLSAARNADGSARSNRIGSLPNGKRPEGAKKVGKMANPARGSLSKRARTGVDEFSAY